MDILDRIAAAIGCQQCGGPLGASPSDDFCDDRCQQAWHAERSAGPAPDLGLPAPDEAFTAAAASLAEQWEQALRHTTPPRLRGRVWLHSPANHDFEGGWRTRLGWLLGFHSPSLMWARACPCTACAWRRWTGR